MSTTDRHESFDAVADAYDRSRPSYPHATFERITAYAHLNSSPVDVLEVGTGTGKATRPLAALGYRILCLEPGANLARLARANLADLSNVAVKVTSFENWDPSPDYFHLAFCAQAFHWLDPTTRLQRLAHVLRPAGVLAVFGNSHSLAPRDLGDAIQQAYRRYAPDLAQRDNAKAWYSSTDSPVADELKASQYFQDFDFHAVNWGRELSPDGYRDLAATYSDHSILPAQQRELLLDSLADAVHQAGGVIRLEYTTALFLARAC